MRVSEQGFCLFLAENLETRGMGSDAAMLIQTALSRVFTLAAALISLAIVWSAPAAADPEGRLTRIHWVESCKAIRDDLLKRKANGLVDLDANGNFQWYEVMAYQHCGRVRRLLTAARDAGIADQIEFWDGTETVSDLILRELPPGKEVDLPILRIVFPENVFFDTASFQPRPEVWPVLQVIADSINKEPDHIALFVAGHSDFRGARDYNEALSRRRARTGLASIKVLGVDRGETYTVAFGEDLPINASLSVADIGVNRRLEFLIAPVAEVAIQYIRKQKPILPCIGNEDREIGYCPDLERPTVTEIPIEKIDTAGSVEGRETVYTENPGTVVDDDQGEKVVVQDAQGKKQVVVLEVERHKVIIYGADDY